MITNYFIKIERFRSVLIIVLCLNICFSTKAQFVERAVEVGVIHKFEHLDLIGGGVAIFDVNNDDLLDIFVLGGARNDVLFINNGVSFDKTLVYLGVEDIDYYGYSSNGVAVGDVNNDGFDDLFICTFGEELPNYIMINNQDNTFDVLPASESGIVEKSMSMSACFGDVNEDGYLDIFVSNYIDIPSTYSDSITGDLVYNHTGYSNFLYLNKGDNSFEEVSEQYGITKTGTSFVSTFTDFDNDNDVDIYVVNDFGEYLIPDELYENQFPNNTFTDISESSGADIGLFGMGIAIGDYDNDLNLDYYVTNIGRNELLKNNGDKTFSLATDFAMVADEYTIGGFATGWGTGFIDYDNNRWLDLFVCNGYLASGTSELINPQINPHAFFENNRNGSFTNVTNEMGIADSGFCRGAAYGDLDNDGDLDLIFVPSNSTTNSPPSFRSNVEVYYNETNSNNNWVKFKLVGKETNRNGYGSHILLHDSNGNTQLREVDGGSSHASANSSIVHFGLGPYSIDSIELFWTNGFYQVERNLEVNQQHLIIERTDNLITNSVLNKTINIKVFPNPADHYINIDVPNSLKTKLLNYKLMNLNGQVVKKGFMNSFPYSISLSEIENQELFLNVFDKNILIGSAEIILSAIRQAK